MLVQVECNTLLYDASYDYCMTSYESNREIGDYIGIERRVGDVIDVQCANGSFRAKVKDVPSEVPTEEYQTKEVIAWSLDTKDIYGLYAQVTEMREMSVSYDVYTIHMPDLGSDSEAQELGDIQRITVEE